ncbi:hypothetical protein [Microbacterium sp. A84]
MTLTRYDDTYHWDREAQRLITEHRAIVSWTQSVHGEWEEGGTA